MLGRLLVIFGVVAGLAVAAPRVVPQLLATAVSAPSPDPVETPGAVPPSATSPGYSRQATLRSDRLGHFAADAVVNGRSLEMMVDTGASIVALTPVTARRLGITPRASDFSLRLSTANGEAMGAPVTLGEIRVGDVVVRAVPAVVIAGNGLGVDLLGMSFLKRLTRFEVADGQLLLVQ